MCYIINNISFGFVNRGFVYFKQKGSCVQNDPRGDGLLCQDTGRRHTNTADNESAVDYGTSFDAATGYGRSFDAAT